MQGTVLAHASHERGPKFFELIGKYPLHLEKASKGFYTKNTSLEKAELIYYFLPQETNIQSVIILSIKII